MTALPSEANRPPSVVDVTKAAKTNRQKSPRKQQVITRGTRGGICLMRRTSKR